jgi:hypothetical protein
LEGECQILLAGAAEHGGSQAQLGTEAARKSVGMQAHAGHSGAYPVLDNPGWSVSPNRFERPLYAPDGKSTDSALVILSRGISLRMAAGMGLHAGRPGQSDEEICPG